MCKRSEHFQQSPESGIIEEQISSFPENVSEHLYERKNTICLKLVAA